MRHNAYMILKPIDPSDALPLADGAAKAPKGLPTGDDLKRLLSVEQQRLGELQSAFYADRRHALLVVLQGRDASGKDGTIRSVFDACNPQGCQVASFKAPTDLELSHDFLWRVHQVVPPKGMIGIFNRSHYEDVLVVRVKNFVPKSVWSRRYRQINDFEQMLTENGVVILKFFLHISKEEQREQFLERLTDPTKNWKFRAGDLDDRALWGEYTRAYRDALRKCSTKAAPWYLVPSDNRTARNYLITRVIAETLAGLRPEYPRASKEILALKGQLGR
ncbi:MAG: polyphosphate kinase 2 family protein [Gemmatimonadaceae bacterium]|nr:polyphosphate kinase 2 family protein [Gemmatimonadaceae bacterium]